MTRSDRSLLIALWAVAIGLTLVLACGGGGRKSPGQPGASVIPVSTQWGSLSVSWACPGAVFDRSAIERDVARAYARAAQQEPTVVGYRLDGTWALFGGETDPDLLGHHEWDRATGTSRIYLRCPPQPSALAHELFHRFAHQLKLQCDRSEDDGGIHLIDHPKGFDLACRRTP